MTPALIVVGTSLGGLHALTALLSALPGSLQVPIAIVQHRGRDMDGSLAALLESVSALQVVDAEDKMTLEPGHAYLAPPDYHLLVDGRGTVALSVDPAVRFARPSIDVLFESAASVYGPELAAVVLTGASADGADGIRAVRARGGAAIVQDPASAESAVMPAAALAAAPGAAVLPLARIADYLVALTQSGRR